MRAFLSLPPPFLDQHDSLLHPTSDANLHLRAYLYRSSTVAASCQYDESRRDTRRDNGLGSSSPHHRGPETSSDGQSTA